MAINILIKSIKFLSHVKNTLMAYNIPIFLFPTNCKFHPSCSEYSRDAIEKYGFWRGSIKMVTRIARCNIGSRGGVDFA